MISSTPARCQRCGGVLQGRRQLRAAYVREPAQDLCEDDALRGAHGDQVLDGCDDGSGVGGGKLRRSWLFHRFPQLFRKLVKVELHLITVASWIPGMVALFGAKQVEM